MHTSLSLVLYYLDWSYLQHIVLGINFLIPSQGRSVMNQKVLTHERRYVIYTLYNK
jgi:hypothetical protein